MHIEDLGTRTFLMTINKTEIEDGVLSARDGSTEMRLSIPQSLAESLPDTVGTYIVSGPARMKIWVNNDLGISGIEEVDVESIDPSLASIAASDEAIEIPF